MRSGFVAGVVAVMLLGAVSAGAQNQDTLRGCPDATETWMSLRVCEETGDRSGYDRDDFGSAYSSKEDEIVASLPQIDRQVYTPYTCTLFDIEPDGTAATDIEHIIALAEAYDSGLPEAEYRTFAGDLDNLTIAVPSVNRNEKSDRDAGDWMPEMNQGWFASTVVAVKQKYQLSVNPAERDALAAHAWCRFNSHGDVRYGAGTRVSAAFPHVDVGSTDRPLLERAGAVMSGA